MEKRKTSNQGLTVQTTSNQSKRNFIFGSRAIIEAIQAGKEIDRLLVQKNLSNDLINELINLAKLHKVPLSRVPREKLRKITSKNHQGAICFIASIHFSSLDNVISQCFEGGKDPFLLVLDRITDVRNFGAIVRTAECAGVDGIVIPAKGSAQISGDAMKTSAGALNLMPICRVENLIRSLKLLKDNGLFLIACTEKAEDLIFETKLDQPCALIFGSEENGISEEAMQLANIKAKIPVRGKIGSLNVSVAAGIAMYEKVRQVSSSV